ncbi:MAG: HAMP domain-containing histidine kinase [Oscillospiraceae bacterium]|nr:HAMP domain-containing histidine kinase [Oscillospiraceae bacterium]
MIRRLKVKFILLSALSLFVLLAAVVTGMNLLNYRSVVNEADDVLALLSRNQGAFPDFLFDFKITIDRGDRDKRLPQGMSPELPYESRYFSVLFSPKGEVLRTETNQIISVNGEQAIRYGMEALQNGGERGFLDTFRYVKTAEGDRIRVTFLDCGRKLDAFRNFLTISVLMAAAGFVIVFLVIAFFAGKFIRPIAESHEKQKRFITDAGHEIKTPLTIINANVDLLEMDMGKNECLQDIRQQAKRLTSLTNDLVSLARMEEAEQSLSMIEFPVSEVVEETATPFKTLAQVQEKTFLWDVQPMLSMRGNDKAVSQLVSLLLDNALKYSPAGGTVSLRFARKNRTLLLTVTNTTATPVPPEALSRVFDRFYRTDPSRNSETGGHGIGLSLAKAIVTAHGGKITAETADGGKSFRITASLPVS